MGSNRMCRKVAQHFPATRSIPTAPMQRNAAWIEAIG